MNGKFSDFLRHPRKISAGAAIFARFALLSAIKPIAQPRLISAIYKLYGLN